MSFDTSLLEILVCPSCKGALVYNAAKHELHCAFDKLAFDVKEGIPILLVAQAKPLQEDAGE
ncbi:MAG: Trm112 family protein [Pseudomonadota bacterium]